MATRGAKAMDCKLAKVAALKLQDDRLHILYRSIAVLSVETIIIVDYIERKLRLYSCRNGTLLATSDQLAKPRDVCVLDDTGTKVAVTLKKGQIEILSVESKGLSVSIRRLWILDVRSSLARCYGLGFLKSRRMIVVSGMKIAKDTKEYFCWGLVPLENSVVGTVNKITISTVHEICKYGFDGYSYLATDDERSSVYITCSVDPDSLDNGVYAFDVMDGRKKFAYCRKDLQNLNGISVDRMGFIYVCHRGLSCIYRLTNSLELVTKHIEGIPPQILAMCMDKHHTKLYVTSFGSAEVCILHPEWMDQQGVPIEILKMDARSIQLFEEALKAGKENVYNIRVMVVGHVGVGKTTLIKRLLGEEVDIAERRSTEGVDVYVNCCDVSLSSHIWTQRKKDSEQDDRLRRLAKVLTDQHSTRNKAIDEEQAAVLLHGVRTDDSANITDKEQVVVPPEGDGIIDSHIGSHVSVEDKDIEALSTGSHSLHQDFGQHIASAASQRKESPTAVAQRTLTQSETSTMAMLKLLKENPDKFQQDAVKYAPLTIWDFAGHYAFYTTHQTFLTRRAIYLLVSDVSGHVTDPVDDECYFDSEGIVKCRVHDLNEVWINSIHSCAPSPEAGIPPVILVGTHVDKISKKQLPAKRLESEKQIMTSDTAELALPITPTPAPTSKEWPRTSTSIWPMRNIADLNTEYVATEDESEDSESRNTENEWDTEQSEDSESKDTEDIEVEKYCHEICERYFGEIRSYLRDKPTRFHLVNEDFAIDNTIIDRKLKYLKRKIIEVASQQPYWGEQIPARWIPMEQELMRLRAAGIKVIPLSLLEDLNKAGTVQISTDELDLFLRFQHDIGTIFYFSTEVLKMKIVLVPQWMIDALKSLITAEMFVLRNSPTVSKKWFEFKENGKLFPELIDAIWTKENNPDLHDNRVHILLLMEQMNIIAKPMVYGEDALEVKEENYYLAPCMLRQETPEDVICPKPNPQMETSSVLCYVFAEKYLPSPIFHRLLAACVARWPLATKKKEKVKENQIFCGCGVFQLDQCHKLILHFREYVIFMRVTRMGIKERTPSLEVCIGAREFITAMLSKIIGYLSQNLRYELFIQCPEYSGVSVNSLIPVSLLEEKEEVCCDFHDNIIESRNLLKFWFNVQEQSADGNSSRVNKTNREAEHQISETLYCSQGKRIRMNALKGPLTDPKLLCQVLKKSTEVNSSSRRILKENCQLMGLEFHGETLGNGNCFFEAVSSQLQRLNCAVQKSPQQLRHDVVAFMKANTILQVSEGTINLAEFISNGNFNDYCERMAQDGEWADHVVVVGMARMLQKDIMLVTSAPSSGPDNIIAWVVGQTSFNGEPILLGHIWENHYQSLQPMGSDDRKQLLTAETLAKMEQVIQTNDPVEQICSRISLLNTPERHKLLLPPGKKYHVFFSYASPDIQWVKETVKRLENNHGFVCCEYDRDNTPGTPLLSFAADGIKYAIKTVVVMTKDAFESGYVELEIQMALQQRCDTGRKCVVPVLVQDCTIPDYLRILSYVDARDPSQIDIWWPKLLIELQTQDNAQEDLESNQGTQYLSEEPSTQLEHGDSKEEQQQLYRTTESGTWV